MADYDYFYKFENFIGYTGDLANNPTLYFMDKSYYGRITTQHRHANNVGRAAPKSLVGYRKANRLMNTKNGPEVRLLERNTRLGKRHKSRNALIECLSTADRANVKARVLRLIATNTEIKSKDDLSSRQFHEFISMGVR